MKSIHIEPKPSVEDVKREESVGVSERSSRNSVSSASLDFSLKPCASGPINEGIKRTSSSMYVCRFFA